METTNTADKGPIPAAEAIALEQREDHCQQHGAYTSRRLAGLELDEQRRAVWSSCPTCRGLELEALERHEQRQNARREQQDLERRFTQCGLPPRFRDCAFENYRADLPEQVKALTYCRRFADNFREVLARGKTLTMTGPTGTGKTHLGAAVLRQVTAAGYSGLYREAAQAVRYVKASYAAESGYTEDQAIEHLRAADLLVLDELGNQHDTQDEKRVLFSIVNARYMHRRPTLYLSNLSAEQLRAWGGQAFEDRLHEEGAILAMAWDSYRRAKK